MAWCEEWNPDVIVTASTVFPGTVAAETCQIPYANVNVDQPPSFDTDGNGLRSPAVIVGMLEQLVVDRQSYSADSRNL